MRLPIALFALALGFVAASASAKPALTGCDAFLEKLRAEASDLGVDFSHALIVSRAKSESNVFDITTKADVDGQLTCHNDAFVRFEAHVAVPPSARAMTAFESLNAAALRAGLGWDAAKSRSMVRSMAADARDYFAASRQRGDVYISGKTEEHVPGGVSLGLIYTDVDRAFIVVAPEP